jgi:glycosyltransferase involved in cell wall biosynthesis
MRILFATSIRTWGGGEEWMLSQAVGLSARGHDVALGARPESAILARAREAGLPTLSFGLRSDADLITVLRAFLWCRRRRIDAVCVNMDRTLRTVGLAARLAGVPVVLPRRGSEFPLKNGPLYRWSYRRIATGMIVNSRATAKTLVRDIAWRPAGEIHVLPNALDLGRADAARPRAETRAALGLSETAPVIVAVGELTKRKNLARLLEAVASLRATYPELAILVAGEGVERDALRRQAEDLGLSSKVHFLGFRRDVSDLLAAADLLVHPALVEGFGYVIAEAMAAGLAVVGTDASSIPEIVVPGETGILFPPDDVDALRSGIAAYLADPERRSADGRRGRERVEREFAAERRLVELESILGAGSESGESRGTRNRDDGIRGYNQGGDHERR